MTAGSEEDAGQGLTGALAALVDVTRDADIHDDYRTMSSIFEVEDYRTIIDLAWRHQFNDERLNFKREIRELQQHVCSRVPIRTKDDAE